MTIVDRFLQRTAEHPERIAIVEPHGRTASYSELAERSAELACAFAQRGIGSGDRVLVAVWPSTALYASLAAIWRLGAVAVLPEAATGLAGLRHAAAATSPRAILADRFIRSLSLLLPETRRIPLALSPRMRGGSATAPIHPASAGDAALISFTSGTTGKPKGIVRSHGLMLAQQDALAPIIAPRDGHEVDLVAFPAFVLACLGHGITAVMPSWDLRRHDGVSAQGVSRQVLENGVTRLLVPPVVMARLAREGLTAPVRRVLTGGGPVYPDVVRAFLARNPGVGLTVVYGSTEAEPISYIDAAAISDDDWREAAEGGGLLVGAAVAEAAVRIESDEILVAGPHVNESYMDPSRNAETKVRIGDRIYHRTGDAGRFDTKGRLWLLGRTVVARPGVYPFAIETAARMEPGVTGAALIAVNDNMILFVEGANALLNATFAARLEELGVEVRAIASIPLDHRHRSKPDYAALVRIASRH